MFISNNLFYKNLLPLGLQRKFTNQSQTKIGIYPDSFDPPTLGHIDAIEKASKLFRKVHVYIAMNPNKKAFFSLKDRVKMLELATKHTQNVYIHPDKGNFSNFAEANKASFLLQVIRNSSDCEIDEKMYKINKAIGGLETFSIFCPQHLNHISSSLVRTHLPFGNKVKPLISSPVAEWLIENGQLFMPVTPLNYANKRLKAAGILPYAQNKDGRIYVLLGRQSFYNHSSDGLWKGFGGVQEKKETLIETAVREAKEETRGVLGIDSPCYNIKALALDHIIATVHHQKKYVQFMVPVPWNPEVPKRFSKLKVSDPYQLEKTALCWVEFHNLYNTLAAIHKETLKTGLSPTKTNYCFTVRSQKGPLELDKDFVETLLINYRNPYDSIHQLACEQFPVLSSQASDE